VARCWWEGCGSAYLLEGFFYFSVVRLNEVYASFLQKLGEHAVLFEDVPSPGCAALDRERQRSSSKDKLE